MPSAGGSKYTPPPSKPNRANVQQGGRFASASDNKKNKARTQEIQAEQPQQGGRFVAARSQMEQQAQRDIIANPTIQQERKAYTVNLNERLALDDKIRKRQSVTLKERVGVSDNARKSRTVTLKENTQVPTTPPTTVSIQKSERAAPTPLRKYEKDTRTIEQQIKAPVPAVQTYGPYIETQQQADIINRNRQKFIDDINRSRQITFSSVSKTLGLQGIPGVAKIAKNIDTSLELEKLPKERGSKNTPIFGQDFVSLPSNRKIGEQLSPITNFGADIADLGRATVKSFQSGGKEGFVKDKNTGLPVAEPYYYKQPIDSPEIIGANVGVIAAAASAGASAPFFNAPIKTPNQPIKAPSIKPFYKPNLKLGPSKNPIFGKTFPKTTLNEALRSQNLPSRTGTTIPKPNLKLGPSKNPIFGKTFPKTTLSSKTSSSEPIKFSASDFSLGWGAVIVPKGFGTGGTTFKPFTGKANIVKPEFTEPKAPSNNGLITQQKPFSQTKVSLGEAETQIIKQIQKQSNKRQSSSLDNLFSKPKNVKYKKSAGTDYVTEEFVKYQEKPPGGLLTKPKGQFGIFSDTATKVKPDVKPKSGSRQKPKEGIFIGSKEATKTINDVITKQVPKLGQPLAPDQTHVPKFDFPNPPINPPIFPQPTPILTTPRPPEVPPTRGSPFLPYFPNTYLGEFGYEDPGSLRKGFAAYGISSDINIKTLPTYSRYSRGKGVFKQQAAEDKRIQDLFYGKKTKSKSKKSKTKKSSGKKRKSKK